MSDKNIREEIYENYRTSIESILSKAKECKTTGECLDNFSEAFEVKKNMVLDYCAEAYRNSLSEQELFEYYAQRKFFANKALTNEELDHIIDRLGESATMKHIKRQRRELCNINV